MSIGIASGLTIGIEPVRMRSIGSGIGPCEGLSRPMHPNGRRRVHPDRWNKEP